MSRRRVGGTTLRRFLLGEPLDGMYHTNATFLKQPTKVMHPRGRLSPHWWHWRPGWHRAAIRVACVLAAIAIAWGLFAARTATLAALAVLPAAAAVRGGWWVYRKARRWWPQSN